MEGGVRARRGYRAAPEPKERAGRVGMGENQRREGEGLDVPHDVTAVVVVLGCIRQSEDAGAGQRRRTCRRMQIVEARIRAALPVFGPVDERPPLPQVGPRLAVRLAQRVPTAAESSGHEQRRLSVRARMRKVRNQADDRSEPLRLTGSRVDRIRHRDETLVFPDLHDRIGVHVVAHRGDDHAAPRRAAHALPGQPGIGGRRLTARDVVGV